MVENVRIPSRLKADISPFMLRETSSVLLTLGVDIEDAIEGDDFHDTALQQISSRSRQSHTAYSEGDNYDDEDFEMGIDEEMWDEETDAIDSDYFFRPQRNIEVEPKSMLVDLNNVVAIDENPVLPLRWPYSYDHVESFVEKSYEDDLDEEGSSAHILIEDIQRLIDNPSNGSVYCSRYEREDSNGNIHDTSIQVIDTVSESPDEATFNAGLIAYDLDKIAKYLSFDQPTNEGDVLQAPSIHILLADSSDNPEIFTNTEGGVLGGCLATSRDRQGYINTMVLLLNEKHLGGGIPVLSHEIAHVLDALSHDVLSSSQNARFSQKIKEDKLFNTTYAQKSAAEFFAELFSLATNNTAYLEEMDNGRVIGFVESATERVSKSIFGFDVFPVSAETAAERKKRLIARKKFLAETLEEHYPEMSKKLASEAS